MDIATSQHSVRKTRCYIDGQWVGNGDTPVINPATGETIAHVPYLGEAETNQAIAAASTAFKTWSAELAKT
ncbi:MAG: aldehyde dehydrogenase family protein, partial [Pseudomonadota bacterium]